MRHNGKLPSLSLLCASMLLAKFARPLERYQT